MPTTEAAHTMEFLTVAEKRGRAFLKRVSAGRTGENWTVEIVPDAADGAGEVTFRRTVPAAAPGDPEREIVVVFRGGLPWDERIAVRAADSSPLMAYAGPFDGSTVALLLLEGWKLRIGRPDGSEASKDIGIVIVRLEAFRGGSYGPAVTLRESVYHNGRCILGGVFPYTYAPPAAAARGA